MKSKAWSNRLTTKHNALTAIQSGLTTKHDALTTKHNGLKLWHNVLTTKYNAFTMHWQRVATHLRWLFSCRVFANRVTIILRRIGKYLSRQSTETLIHAFVSSRVDYCNSLLYGLPAYQLNKLQRVQNATTRLIFQESKYCHVRLLLYNLHWLPVKFWIDFKIL